MNLRKFFQQAEDAQEFKAGATVFAEGAQGDIMYVVLDGELEMLAGGVPVDIIGPGDIVGEMVLIDDKTRSATVVAKSDCRLAPVDKRRFMFMVQETPFFALHVMRILADRLRRCQTGTPAAYSQSPNGGVHLDIGV
ncbi:MAG TPA: cyclic nucleotide-binding domain-containing protein [Syntrophobacteraceae bacterium]|nr:cyclic nucleotide-binding domain-containing protein [Syntrophobacteraceae bacterium]